jgi:phage shock protein A
MEAEKTVNELRTHVGELHAMVASLRHQVEQLKAENMNLRGCRSCEM